eukprot:TRINITY_DN79613_c0_g1_i1.p1 TRINITY_DN79613_c0_g1~~TRINITY_DN79613_c0_g1_i1.p1  ORF type:complete len:119 (-),score=26.46 TRINITY_DN79613_c0_g1_i1:212-568(-)
MMTNIHVDNNCEIHLPSNVSSVHVTIDTQVYVQHTLEYVNPHWMSYRTDTFINTSYLVTCYVQEPLVPTPAAESPAFHVKPEDQGLQWNFGALKQEDNSYSHDEFQVKNEFDVKKEWY